MAGHPGTPDFTVNEVIPRDVDGPSLTRPHPMSVDATIESNLVADHQRRQADRAYAKTRYPYWVCWDCGSKATASCPNWLTSYHYGFCEMCGDWTDVTEP